MSSDPVHSHAAHAGRGTGLSLVSPHRRFHRSFLEAADEFLAVGDTAFAMTVDWPADEIFAGASYPRDSLENAETFGAFVDFLVSQSRAETPRPKSFVPFTELWMTVDREFLGRLSLRHELNELLLEWGGHVGYAVRPTARGKGCATRALRLALPRAAELGIGNVLVTCDVDNIASRRVIESNGGVYEDTRDGKLRFWISSSPTLVS